MLKVNGMATAVMNAGNASEKSGHSTRATDCIISPPTTTRAGAVANAGMLVASGLKNSASTKSAATIDRKSTRLNSSHPSISYAVFCLKKKKKKKTKIKKKTHIHGTTMQSIKLRTRQ